MSFCILACSFPVPLPLLSALRLCVRLLFWYFGTLGCTKIILLFEWFSLYLLSRIFRVFCWPVVLFSVSDYNPSTTSLIPLFHSYVFMSSVLIYSSLVCRFPWAHTCSRTISALWIIYLAYLCNLLPSHWYFEWSTAILVYMTKLFWLPVHKWNHCHHFLVFWTIPVLDPDFICLITSFPLFPCFWSFYIPFEGFRSHVLSITSREF